MPRRSQPMSIPEEAHLQNCNQTNSTQLTADVSQDLIWLSHVLQGFMIALQQHFQTLMELPKRTVFNLFRANSSRQIFGCRSKQDDILGASTITRKKLDQNFLPNAHNRARNVNQSCTFVNGICHREVDWHQNYVADLLQKPQGCIRLTSSKCSACTTAATIRSVFQRGNICSKWKGQRILTRPPQAVACM